MSNTNQNIRKLLIQTKNDDTIDSELENSIMDKIHTKKNHTTILKTSKRNAKIGALISIILFVVYGYVTYYQLLNSKQYTQHSLNSFYPSIFTAIVVTLVYLQMVFGITVFKKTSKLK